MNDGASARPDSETVRGRGNSPLAQQRFRSFDGGVSAAGHLQRPDRHRFWTPGSGWEPSIARGSGLSYAAASFRERGLSIEHRAFNRILGFSSTERIVEVEAGIELSALHDFLSARGAYLPVQPGHGRITVGGCVAADVHGKNQARDGTFINQVVRLTLFHPEQGLIEVDPDKEPTLFRLTCGGYGLTGHILRVRLQASPIPADAIELHAIPIDNVASGVVRLAKDALESDFAYTWHDFALKGLRFGRGFLFSARFAAAGQQGRARTGVGSTAPPPLSASGRAAWRLPLLNRWTTPILNFAYRSRQQTLGAVRSVTLCEVLFPTHRLQYYFGLFGARGFHEYQTVIPNRRIDEYLAAVGSYLAHRPVAVTLASGKLFGGDPELLRFSGAGTCFTLNFPRTRGAPEFLAFLDKLVVRCEGRPNLIKDSRLPRAVVDACYPDADRFRSQLRAFDPKRLFRSELSERLGL